MDPLRISYLLEDSAQAGGVRVVLAQSDELVARGHRVRLLSKAGPPAWRSFRAEWHRLTSFDAYDATSDDFVIGTFWTTVEQAWKLAGSRSVHLCQGFEGAFSHFQTVRPRIESVYALPIPKVVVARSLVDICRRFASDVSYVGQVVEDEFFRAQSSPVNGRPRVLLTGPIQAGLKGVQDGYGAVAVARAAGADFSLIRVSPWPPAADEPLGQADEFHVALPTAEMTRVMHSCHAFLGPNHEEEGFGLPAAEAMASGIPCLLSSIPSYLSFDQRHDYAIFRPAHDPRALGDGLLELLHNNSLRERLSIRGREVAEQFRAARVADRLESFFAARLSASKRIRTSDR